MFIILCLVKLFNVGMNEGNGRCCWCVVVLCCFDPLSLLWSFDKFDRDKILSIVHRAIPLVLFLKLLIEVCLASLKKNYSSLASDAAQAIFTIRPASLSATTGSTVLYVINRFDLLNRMNQSNRDSIDSICDANSIWFPSFKQWWLRFDHTQTEKIFANDYYELFFSRRF